MVVALGVVISVEKPELEEQRAKLKREAANLEKRWLGAQRAQRARTVADGHAAIRTHGVAFAASSRACDETTDAPT